MGMRIWLAALSAALALGACGLPRASPTSSASAGNPAPAFDLVGVDGARHSLSSYRGRVVVLNFWATWCIPCRAEMPDLEHAARIHRGGPRPSGGRARERSPAHWPHVPAGP